MRFANFAGVIVPQKWDRVTVMNESMKCSMRQVFLLYKNNDCMVRVECSTGYLCFSGLHIWFIN